MKAHFFHPKVLIFIIVFLATFKFACDINRFLNEAAMWVFSHYITEKLEIALNCHMCATSKFSPLAPSVRNVDN